MDKNPDSITQTNSGYSRPVCMTLNDRNDALNTFYEYCNTCVMFFAGIFYVLAQIHLGAEHPTLKLVLSRKLSKRSIGECHSKQACSRE